MRRALRGGAAGATDEIGNIRQMQSQVLRVVEKAVAGETTKATMKLILFVFLIR
jgi:hypothetical protein